MRLFQLLPRCLSSSAMAGGTWLIVLVTCFGLACLAVVAVAVTPHLVSGELNFTTTPLRVLYTSSTTISCLLAASELISAISNRGDRRALLSLLCLCALSTLFAILALVYAALAIVNAEPTILAPYTSTRSPRNLTIILLFNGSCASLFIVSVQFTKVLRASGSGSFWMLYAAGAALPSALWWASRFVSRGPATWVLCAAALAVSLLKESLVRCLRAASARRAKDAGGDEGFSVAETTFVAAFGRSINAGEGIFTVASVVYLAGGSGPVYSEAVLCGVILFR